MGRFLYTFQQAIQLRHKFKNLNISINHITDLNLAMLKQNNIKVLVLDFDGVLNSHGEIYPRTDVEVWLKAMVASLGAKNVFILSNKPLLIRHEFFEQNYPGVRFIAGVRKKPYPDGLNKIIELAACKPEELALADDRLLTGVLATKIAGCQSIYIKKPYTQFNKRFVKEFVFANLRFLEKLIF